MIFHHAHGGGGGHVEIQKGGLSGDIIGNFYPTGTGSWSTYITSNDLSISSTHSSVENLAFNGRGGNGVFHLMSFELSGLVSIGHWC